MSKQPPLPPLLQGEAPPRRCEPVLDPVLLSVAILWGGNFPVYKRLMAVIDPVGLLSVRFAAMGGLLLIILAATGRLRHTSRTMWLPVFVAGVLIMGLQQLSFVTGLNLTAAGEGSLLFSTAPVFTALIATLLGTEVIAGTQWLGVLAAFAGAALVITGGAHAHNVPATRVTGDLLMLASAVGYGLFMVVSKPLMERHGALKVLTFAYLFGGLVVVPFGWQQATEVDWAHLGLTCWLCLGWLILLAGVYGFTAWYWRIARTSATRVAVYQYLVPVVAMITAAVWLGERPAGLQVVGAVVVLAGLALARRPTPVECLD